MGTRKFRSAAVGVVATVLLAGGAASGAASGLAAPSNCAALSLGAASFAQLNVAASRGCVLPALDPVAQAPVAEQIMEPAAVGVPQRAAFAPRGLIIASALAAGLAVAVVASDGSNGRLPVSS